MKLILALAVFTPGFAMLGAFSTLDSKLPLWWGLTIGALVGLMFGMVFGHSGTVAGRPVRARARRGQRLTAVGRGHV